MSRNFLSTKKINLETQHDIKLELDVRCQKRITATLRSAFPDSAILGEEGVTGDPQADWRWVVDPIDGTVNFTYGIPHACVSIALQRRVPENKADRKGSSGLVGKASARVGGKGGRPGLPSPEAPQFQSVVGVVHDPFCRETFTGIRGQPARLNGRRIQVSRRGRLEEAIVSIGFAKTRASLEGMLPAFARLVHRVRKIRIMGAAALSLAYVASGRMEAYLEEGLSLWDIAAGGLILECAGGDFCHWPLADKPNRYGLVANNGLLRARLGRLVQMHP